MNFERPHKKLDVYNLSIELVKDIYLFTNRLPVDEKYGLVSQFKRASISVPCNIAEGAARNTKKEFANFLFMSQGSLSELDTLMDICQKLEFINGPVPEYIYDKINRSSLMLSKLINKLRIETT